MDLEPGSTETFKTQMNATFHRADFWGAWMATDYYDNQVQLEFGPAMASKSVHLYVMDDQDTILRRV